MHDIVKTLRTGSKQPTTASSWATANLILFIQNLIYVCHLFTGTLRLYRIRSKLLLRIQGCFKFVWKHEVLVYALLCISLFGVF